MSITLFQSIGQGGKAAALTLLRQLLFFIPFILLLPRLLPAEQEVQGVFLAPVITDILVLFLAMGMVIVTFRKFKNNEVKEGNKKVA